MALINLRNALMAGRRLPYDAEVECLESTGTQWIDTGVYGDSDTVAELTFAMTDSSRSDAGIFGSRKGYMQDCFTVLRVQSSNGAFWMHYGNEGTNANYISTVIGSTTAWHTARLARSWSIDNSAGAAGQYTFTTPTTLKVFAADMSASGRWYAKMRLASLKIYSSNLLIRDFIPVRVGTTGYLYDRVSGKLFGNAGTGDFVLGQDVVPVEYIESHGTEWIDTGFKSDNTCKISVDMENRANVRSSWVFGSRNGSSSAIDKSCLFMQVSDGSLGYAMLGSGMVEFDSSLIKNNRHTVEMSLADGVVVDGVAVATFTPSQQTDIFTNTFPMVLFNLWNGSSLNNYFQGRIYGFSVKSNGIPRLKYAPVRVGTEGAMMDVLTRRIYRNAGTGAFGYGNDLKYPIPAS